MISMFALLHLILCAVAVTLNCVFLLTKTNEVTRDLKTHQQFMFDAQLQSVKRLEISFSLQV